jgi:alkanesulfonate monooxygenase SsuD/methylene tetrahydromethanopterin reductase-like flavin-dependent oxidoreductase (luciferase family)
MDIGIGAPSPVKDVEGRTLVAWARRAEEMGFSTLATIGRVAYPSHDDLTTLAAAAGATERIGLLTNILLAPTRQPLILAKQAATLDRLSGGRFTLGLAVGGRRDDLDVLGVDFATRGRRTDEMLAVMKAAWRGEPPAGTTEPVTPRPTRPDGVPMMFGGTSAASIRRTVEHGIGWTAGGGPPDQAAPFVERVRGAWKDAGREGDPRIVCLTYFSVGEEERSRAYLLDYYAQLGEWAQAIADGAARTPQALRDRMRAFEDLGIDELIFDPTVADLDQVDRLAEIVL